MNETPTEDRHSDMPLLEHLRELRKRLIISIASIATLAIIAYLMSGVFFELLARPYYGSFESSALIGTGPAEAFLLKIKLALFGGLILASPILFYQLWLFIAPGLLEHERRLAIPFLLCSTALFLLGLWFCYSVVLPYAYRFFFAQYQSIDITPTVKINEHLGFLMRILIAFGCIFEMPVLAYFLGKLGIITASTLISGFRYAVVVIFLLAAMLTPPDVITQLLMAGRSYYCMASVSWWLSTALGLRQIRKARRDFLYTIGKPSAPLSNPSPNSIPSLLKNIDPYQSRLSEM